MKETDKRKGVNNKEKSHPARPETRERKLHGNNGGKNIKEKEIAAKLSDKLNRNTVRSDLKGGVRPSEAFENVVIDYVDDAFRSVDALHLTKAFKRDERRANEKLSDNSSDMEILDESDADDSVSSHGDLQTVEEDKVETVTRVRIHSSGSDGYSKAQRSKSDRRTNHLQSKAPKQTARKVPELGLSKLAKSSSDNLKNMKLHPIPLSDSSERADDQPLEQNNGVHILDEASNGSHTMFSANEAVETGENHKLEDKAATDQKIKKMETRIKNLECELREVAALEIALYSVVPEHGSSAHKVHTPARRLSRLYIYACKYWSKDRRATVARNTVSGLVLVSKSCGNDVSRLTFWLSNTVVLREIIFQAFGSSCHSNAQEKVFKSNGTITKSSTYKSKNRSTNGEMNKMGFLQFVDDWQETRTFTPALEKIESWIFSRIVESIWWQTLTPNMQSVGDSITHKGSERLLGPALGDRKQGSFSINLWKNAFHDALRRLCPVRAGGHECGCLPILARKVMEQCIGRLDVAMFNAILRESIHDMPTDPVSDPIVDSKVLPIPAGDLSFGSGAQLKNSVGNWGRWLSDFISMDADSSAKYKNGTLDNDDDDDDDKQGTKEPKYFPLLNALSDLLMLPKGMLMDRTIRMEVCPSISLPLVKRVLCNFSPDEFCPDPVPGAVLEALNAECMIERTVSGESTSSFPYPAAPTVYTPPASSKVARSQLLRSASSVERKGYTSDEELDEVESCLSSVIDKPSPTAVVSGNRRGGGGGANARYDLLREVWQFT